MLMLGVASWASCVSSWCLPNWLFVASRSCCRCLHGCPADMQQYFPSASAQAIDLLDRLLTFDQGANPLLLLLGSRMVCCRCCCCGLILLL